MDRYVSEVTATIRIYHSGFLKMNSKENPKSAQTVPSKCFIPTAVEEITCCAETKNKKNENFEIKCLVIHKCCGFKKSPRYFKNVRNFENKLFLKKIVYQTMLMKLKKIANSKKFMK